MNDPTIALNGSEGHVLKVKEVDKTLTQAYTWKTGTSFFLSKKEWIVAETYLKTRSYMECERALKKEGFNKSWQSCRRWLERDHVKKWMMEKLEESGVYAGWTKEHWFKVMSDHLRATQEVIEAQHDLDMLLEKYKEGVEGIDYKARIEAATIDIYHAKKMRLANGDLYGMKLIAEYKGWGDAGVGTVTNINILQANGKE